ncbi:MAG: aminotransferase class III-fold pyridoxal phosphate-dependent enzyme, partial [Magnetococcales bacterium]|nr:aminotransferase class III-fold pyridoxal phosphate-dependent enzyme [Magnetococcales bacterium]NGZ29025.1 aminotransferase class III-fold pyridoxal phosphate-dependent enzyme [Magnetococcales bacterium]
AAAFTPGAHGSTFGGSPLVSAAALAHLDLLENSGVLEQVTEKGQYLLEKLTEIASRHKLVKAVRGKGLMLAVELNDSAQDVAAVCLSRGLLVSCQKGTTIRLLPPLVVSRTEMDEGLEILKGVFNDVL